MSYYCFTFSIREPWQQELFIAALDEIGFNGFEEREYELLAFIPADLYEDLKFQQCIAPLIKEYSTSCYRSELPDQNWNKLWEQSFQPIQIGVDIVVRASFHETVPGVQHDIVIDPKMSFGTGHHATTAMMLQFMLEEDLQDKHVLDFGSGTGILSILAAKSGAADILSIDHEEWAYHNALENFKLNKVHNATALQGEAPAFSGKTFDIILANINRTVIVDAMPLFRKSLSLKGVLLISGFLISDEFMITGSAAVSGFRVDKKTYDGDWVALRLVCR